ncbi:MAG: HAD family hydrolase [Chitinivibrionales bacterium]
MTEYILFDLGMVLVELTGFKYFRPLCPELSDQEIKEMWGRLKSVAEYESGKTDSSNFFRSIIQELNLDTTEDEFCRAFKDFIGDEFKGTTEFLRSLKRDYSIGCLSNTNPVHIKKVRETSDMLSEMDHLFFSYEIGYIKPQKEIYRHVCRSLNIPPENILFLDDSKENVTAARDCGFKGEQVCGIDQAKEAIESLRQRIPWRQCS